MKGSSEKNSQKKMPDSGISYDFDGGAGRFCNKGLSASVCLLFFHQAGKNLHGIGSCAFANLIPAAKQTDRFLFRIGLIIADTADKDLVLIGGVNWHWIDVVCWIIAQNNPL